MVDHGLNLNLNEHNSASYEASEINQRDDNRTRRHENREEILGHGERFTTEDVLDMLPFSTHTHNAKEIISCSATGCTRIAAADQPRFCLNHMVENLNAGRISEEEIKNSGRKSRIAAAHQPRFYLNHIVENLNAGRISEEEIKTNGRKSRPRVKFSATQHKESHTIHTPFTPNRDRHISPVSTPKHKAYSQNDTESGPDDYSMLIVDQGQSSVNDTQEHGQLTQPTRLPEKQLMKSPRASEHVRNTYDVGACCTPKQEKCIYKNCTNEGSTFINGLCTPCYNVLLEKNARKIAMPSPVVRTRYGKLDKNNQCKCKLNQGCQCRCLSCGMLMSGGCYCGHCELSCFKNQTSDSANVSNKVRGASSNPGAYRSRPTYSDLICHGCPNCMTSNKGHESIGHRTNGLEPTLNNAHWNLSDLAIDGPSPRGFTRSCSQGLYDVESKHSTFDGGTGLCSDSSSKYESIASPPQKEESCEYIVNSENEIKSSYKPTDRDSCFSSILCFGDVEVPYSYLSKGGVWDKSYLG